MIRALLVLGLIAGCSGDVTEAGRVVIDRSGKTVVVRDSMRVLEIDFAKSSLDHAFEPLDLPAIEFPGRLAIQDKKRTRMLVFWITKLGGKRPENIQRWFDGKLARLKGDSVIEDRAVAIADHPGRVVDYWHQSDKRKTRQRFIGIDLPEHDLAMVMLALAETDMPYDVAWLDDVLADVRALRVVAPKP